jgi:hypothetical protein
MITLHPDALVDVPALRAYLPEVKESTVWVWVHRGRLTPRGRDRRGRYLYRWGDLASLLRHAERRGLRPE